MSTTPATATATATATDASGRLAPATWLRLEGLALLGVAVLGYAALPDGPSWLVFAAAFLLPDVAMLGYLRGPVAGAIAYNVAHSEALAFALLALGWIGGHPAALAAALVWLAHIGFDRALGYGLKFTSAFSDTHLGPIGRGRTAAGR